MSIPVVCGQCRAALAVPEAFAGKRVRCPKCQDTFLVPANEAPPAPTVSEQVRARPEPLPVQLPEPPNEEEATDSDEAEDRAPRRTKPRKSSRPPGVSQWFLVGCGAAVGLMLMVMLLFGVWLATRTPAPAIGNTAWEGQEQLQGFGRLRFQFLAGNNVTMVDARQVLNGKYRQSGKSITIDFGRGSVVYRGTIEGNTMAGEADEKGRRWTWQVTKR